MVAQAEELNVGASVPLVRPEPRAPVSQGDLCHQPSRLPNRLTEFLFMRKHRSALQFRSSSPRTRKWPRFAFTPGGC